MGTNDAEERFFDAVKAFQKADEGARSGSKEIDERSFRKVIIDLDAAIPGLEGLNLGRALLLKAESLWWIYFLPLCETSFFDVFEAEKSKPLLAECDKLAKRGRDILVKFGAPETDLNWADDLIQKITQ